MSFAVNLIYKKLKASHFKIISPKLKLKPLLTLNADLRVPVWKSDKGDYILKIKDKFIKTLNELVLKETYLIDLDLVYYDMTGKADMKGYYGAISKVTSTTIIEEN